MAFFASFLRELPFEYQVPKNESLNRIRFTVNIMSAGIFKIDQVEIKPKL